MDTPGPTSQIDVPAASGVISRYADAWRTGDLTTLISCYDEGIIAHYGGRSSFAGTHVGRDRFIEVLAGTALVSERQLVSIDQLHDDGDTGALFVTESLVIGGERHTVHRALRFRVAGDRIVECWLFDHDQHLVDRAWTGSPPAEASEPDQ